jgi:MraZ protein
VAFRGQYDYSLDAKNRLNLPPRWRAQFSEGVVLAKGVDPCIEIFTPEQFEQRLESSLAGKNPMGKEARKITRFYAQNAWDTELDASGRVTVNPKLLEHAGIEKAVIVGGAITHAEVWDPDRWAKEHDELGAGIEELTEGLGDPS